jgi:hypothetical protein
MKQRGVFEKLPGSGIWWICYFDQFGKKRREKAGTKSVATKLYGKRKQQVLEGKKLPEMFRKPSVNFNQLADDALAYSKRNKRSYKTDVPRFANLKEWFGANAAEELAPREIENKLARVAEKEKWAPSTFNHYRSCRWAIGWEYRIEKSFQIRPVRCLIAGRTIIASGFSPWKRKRNLERRWRPSGLHTFLSSIWQSTRVYGRVVNTV